MRRICERETMRTALIVRAGLGWRVGTGRIATGIIDADDSGHIEKREAVRVAADLADRLDLVLVWA